MILFLYKDLAVYIYLFDSEFFFQECCFEIIYPLFLKIVDVMMSTFYDLISYILLTDRSDKHSCKMH